MTARVLVLGILASTLAACGGDDSPGTGDGTGSDSTTGNDQCGPACRVNCDVEPAGTYCESGDEAGVCFEGSCVECITDDDCFDGMPACVNNLCEQCNADDQCDGFCDEPSTYCQECQADADCSREVPDRPLCDAVLGACRVCLTEDDCGGAPCGVDGRCLDRSDYVEVRTGDASSNADCGLTEEVPCASLRDALAQTTADRRVIYVANGGEVVSEPIPVVFDGVDLDIIGPRSVFDQQAGSRVAGPARRPLFLVRGRARLRVRGLELEPLARAIECSDGGIVTLSAVTIRSAGGTGVVVNDCFIELSDSTVRDGSSLAIDAMNGYVTLSRSTIEGNAGGGVALRESGVTIENSFIVRNGTAGANGSLVGGVFTEAPRSQSGSIQLTTLADNLLATGLQGTAVRCEGPSEGQGLRVFDSIVWGTQDGQSLTTEDCNAIENLIETPGTSLDPRFVDPTSGDYHIGADSDAIDLVDTTFYGFDIDREHRPANESLDAGADEVTLP